MQYLTPKLPVFQQQIEVYLSKEVGGSAKIKNLKSSWRWGLPIFVLSDVLIKNSSKQEIIDIKEVSFGINWWKSLKTLHWQPGFILVENPNVILNQSRPFLDSIHELQNTISLPGLNLSFVHDQSSLQTGIVSWLTAQDKIVIKGLTLFVKQNKQGLLPVSKLSLSVINKGISHQLKLTFHLEQLTKSKVYLLASLQGDKLNNLQGKVYLHAQQLLPAQWFNFLWGNNIKLTSGQFSADGWFYLKKGRLNSVKSSINASHLGFLNQKNGQRLLVQSLDSDLLYYATNKLNSIAFKGLHLRLGDERLSNKQLKIAYSSNEILYNLDKISLSTVQKILLFIRPEAEEGSTLGKFYRQLTSASLEGEARDVQLQFNNDHLKKATGRINNLGIFYNNSDSAIKGLNLSYELIEDALTIGLDSKLIYLRGKNYLGKSTYLSKLKANLKLDNLYSIPTLCAREVSIVHPYLSIFGKGCLFKLGTSDEKLDLEFGFATTHGEKIPAYLPKESFSPKLYDFINDSFVFIPDLKGQGIIKAPLVDFPNHLMAENNSTVFDIKARAADVSLRYHKDWPTAVLYDSAIVANKAGLSVNVIKGRVLHIPADNVKLNIRPSGKHNHLFLTGVFKSSGENAKEFVEHSKLSTDLSFLEHFSLTGPLSVALNLELDLTKDKSKDNVRGNIHFFDNKLTLISEPSFSLESLKGKVDFYEHGIINSQLNANLWGESVQLNLNNSLESPHALKLSFFSRIKVKSFSDEMELQVPFLEGSTVAKFSLTHNPITKNVNFSGSLDLQDTGIDLPYPLYKTTNVKKTLDFNGEFRNDAITKFFLKLSDGPTALYTKNQTPKGMLKNIEINSGFVQVANWSRPYSLLAQSIRNKPWHNPSDRLPSITLKSKGLLCDSFKTSSFVLHAEPSTMGYSMHFMGEGLEGVIYDPHYDKGTVVADFAKLSVSTAHKPKKFLTVSKKKEYFPDLDLNIRQLSVDDSSLGELEFRARNRSNNWIVEKFNLENSFSKIAIKGAWSSANNNDKTEVSGYLQSEDVAKTLRLFGKEAFINSSNGILKFHLLWFNSPDKLSFENANGTLSATLKKGSIMHLNKEMEEKVGIGKLLNILSLQTIPRRLVLDFNDLKMGLPFDIISANFVAHDGVLDIKKAVMQGPVASAKIEGSLSVTNKTYDVRVFLDPHVTSSLPVVATIAGGPIAGIATWLVSKVVSNGMHKSKAYAYQVKGPWDSPLINQIH